MHRRGRGAVPGGFVVRFVAVLAIVVALLGGASPAQASPDETPPSRPPVTVSDFIPDDRNLSDCVGLVEKPGCGSEARGGWGQAAIFGALALGLGLIVWRIVVGLRANRVGASDSSATRSTVGRDESSRRPR